MNDIKESTPISGKVTCFPGLWASMTSASLSTSSSRRLRSISVIPGELSILWGKVLRDELVWSDEIGVKRRLAEDFKLEVGSG